MRFPWVEERSSSGGAEDQAPGARDGRGRTPAPGNYPEGGVVNHPRPLVYSGTTGHCHGKATGGAVAPSHRVTAGGTSEPWPT